MKVLKYRRQRVGSTLAQKCTLKKSLLTCQLNLSFLKRNVKDPKSSDINFRDRVYNREKQKTEKHFELIVAQFLPNE